MSSLKILKQEFFVKSAEKSCCPCCGGSLYIYGSRKRGYINSEGIRKVLMIRRLCCEHCGKIHHELPDLLVPYKRYASQSIESVISDADDCCVAADNSTLYRWKKWFSDLGLYFLKSIIAIYQQLDFKTNEEQSRSHGTALEGIISLIGQKDKWLTQVVRKLVNAKMWVQTRSAFLS
jgi:hypothetical protein